MSKNPNPKFKSAPVAAPTATVSGSNLPSWVKCCVCGKPPIGADWLKPTNPSPNCRRFVHLSHISNGPVPSAEAGFILRNS